MGGYLAKPVTAAHVDCHARGAVRVGLASMQGWRPKMEDAHLVDFAVPSKSREREVLGLFGVFDGHGGKEVAQYCSGNLVQCLQSIGPYKRGDDLGACLREVFMRLDCSLLSSRGQRELAALRNEEAYVVCINKELLPMLRQRRARKRRKHKQRRTTKSAQDAAGAGAGAGADAGADSDADDDAEDVNVSPLAKRRRSSTTGTDMASSENDDCDCLVKEQNECKDDSECAADSAADCEANSAADSAAAEKQSAGGGGLSGLPSFLNAEHPIWGRIAQFSEEDEAWRAELAKRSNSQDGDAQTQGKRPRRAGLEILKRSEAAHALSDPGMLCIDKAKLMGERKRPGVDSGSTAVVAALESTADPDVKRLVVVNAGDSRCVLSRGGRAVPMSREHAPLVESERRRILAAGATITEEGRINGKLNLSRAIGDHQFKTARDRELKDQVVTSFAEIQSTLVAKGQDDFCVLACDGIFDCLSSQEVVDFCAKRRQSGEPLHHIAKQLCQHCLAVDPDLDPGTDNMTILIVELF